MAKKLAPMHPGEVLREEFLIPLGLSPGALAKTCGVPRTRIERLANETTNVTADTALRLAKALNTSPQIWLNLQSSYDVRVAESEIGKELAKIAPVVSDAASNKTVRSRSPESKRGIDAMPGSNRKNLASAFKSRRRAWPFPS